MGKIFQATAAAILHCQYFAYISYPTFPTIHFHARFCCISAAGAHRRYFISFPTPTFPHQFSHVVYSVEEITQRQVRDSSHQKSGKMKAFCLGEFSSVKNFQETRYL